MGLKKAIDNQEEENEEEIQLMASPDRPLRNVQVVAPVHQSGVLNGGPGKEDNGNV